MIICKDCGHENDGDDQFCGSCGSFLEWAGAKVEELAPVVVEYETVAEDPTLLQRVRKAIGVDEVSLDEHRQDVRAEVAAGHAEDQALSDQIVAEREAASEAERSRLAEAEAARTAEGARRAQVEAEELAEKAEVDAERMRTAAAEAERLRVADESQSRQRAEAEARRAAGAAEAAARAEIEATRARREQEAEAARQGAAAEAEETARLAAEAKQREAQAEQERVEADRRLAEAAAAASAASLRAAQEGDAIAAAEAARVASEAEAVRVRTEAEASMALAREEAAKARAELADARAEASRLRSEAQGRTADADIERARREAASRADEEATAARRRAEADADIAKQRADADASAAAIRAKAEADAQAREAEAEASRLRSEAAAAKARAAAEKSRQDAEAETAKRARAEALRRASALVAKPSGGARPGTTAVAAKPGPAAKPGTGRGAKADRLASDAPSTLGPAASSGSTPAPTQPGATVPGTERARPAPKRVNTRELNLGDLVCGQCGTGNPPTRKFCRRCGTTLAEAVAVKVGFFARLRRKFRRKPKSFEAGQRRKSTTGAPSTRKGIGNKLRIVWFRLNTHLLKIGAILGLAAVLGLGVEPIRDKLHLPNVRQTVLNKIREFSKPVYDSVRPEAASADSSASDHGAPLAIDLGDNTYWAAAPAATGGVGSTLTVKFAKPFDLGRILIHAGAQGDETPGNGFVNEPRPSELRFTLNNDKANTKTVAVKDTADAQTLTVKGKQVTTVTIEVTGIYPAVEGKGRSVAITELEFFQKRKIGDDYETLAEPAVAVSSAPEGGKLLTDDNVDTAWTSAPAADGVGQGFTVTFAEPVDLDRIRIAPGHAKKDFTISPRPDDVQLVLTCAGGCEPTKQVTFADKAGYKTISLTARGVTQIQVLVRSVHGSGGGVAFAELQFQRKRPKVN